MKNPMEIAIQQGSIALRKGEIPIGAVIVKDGKIISTGRNKREHSQIATDHAEIIAINKACKKLKSWRLDDCEIFVTLEPCPMCAGAILNARIKKLTFGATDEKYGGVISRYTLLDDNILNHRTIINYSYNELCSAMLKEFFKNARNKNLKRGKYRNKYNKNL